MKTIKKIRIIGLMALLITSASAVNAQSLPKLIINQGNSNPSDAKLVVDVTDPFAPQNNEGAIFPRVQTFSPDPDGKVSHGMLVNLISPTMYHGWLHLPGFWYWDTTTVSTGNPDSIPRWTPFISNAQETGDLKNSFRTADHHGWYLLNGRPISSLPAGAQIQAKSLGFTTNLPDATGKYLRQKGTSALASVGGDTTITIKQANLPSVNFTGTGVTSSAGVHFHGPQTGLAPGYHANHGGQPSFLMGNTTNANSGTGYIGGADLPHGINVNYANNWNGVGVAGQTGNAGAHTHTVTVSSSSGGSNAPISEDPWHLNTNIFIYLGGQ